MFTYDEIVGINKDYSPYYDLLNEGKDTWKQFIVTPQFFPLLNQTLDCLEKENISLWLQGAYGTGKSHATGYLKHLLWLPYTDIETRILESGNWDEQVKHRLLNFRKNKKVFPVVMYGADKITNQIDFGLQMEVAVRKALKNNGYEPTIETDFDVYATHIEKDRSNYWETLINDEYEINELVQSKTELIKKLRAYDQDLFIAIRNVLSKRHQQITVPDIISWLTDVCKHLREQKIADYIMIYWDEFTTILDKRNSEIHEYIQRIAEASSHSGVFLYLISHRTIAQGSSKDDRNKLLGRFNDSTYEMSNITTYLLMENSIKKTNYAEWQKHRDLLSSDLDYVIGRISSTEDNVDTENLWNLFPIHPYTAHIATYIARVMGSTERSIFDFLFDDNTGFKHFISTYPGNEGRDLLTVEYVFDFFEKVLAEQGDPFMFSLMQKLNYNKSIIVKENPHYLPLFKALLIMNIAHRRINLNTDHNDIVIPDEDNLKLAMKGSKLSDYIEQFLDFIDQKKILLRDHNDRFIVEATSFDTSALDKWVRDNRGKYSKISDIFVSEHEEKLFYPLITNHRRKDATKCKLEDASDSDHLIKIHLGSKWGPDYNLCFAVFIAHDYTQLESIKERAPKIIQEIDRPVCFVVVDTLFTDTHMDKYLTYKAQSELAHSKHEEEAELTAQKNTKEHLRLWINEAVHFGNVTWYMLDKDKNLLSKKCTYRDMSRLIDTQIAPSIFHKSFDTMGNYATLQPAWDKKMAKKVVEHFLSASSLQDLLVKLKHGPMKAASEILLDKDGAHLVNDKLDLVSHPPEHPLIILQKKIKALLDSNDDINLGDIFSPLFKPPFGYYKNHIFLGAMGFVFRKYSGKLYSPTTGEKLNDISQIELIEKIFKHHSDGNHILKADLAIRVGSAKEGKLVSLLEEIFALEDCNSIVDARYKLANKLKQNVQMPLWLLRFSKEIDDDIKLCIQIIADQVIAIHNESKSLSPADFASITQELSPHKTALNELFSQINNDMRANLLVRYGVEEIEAKHEDLFSRNVEDLEKHLSRFLQGDPVYWNEKDMQNAYNKWLISYLTSSIGGGSTTPRPDDGGTREPKDTVTSSKVWELVKNHEDKTLDILKDLINTDSHIRQILYERLKDCIE